MKLAVNYSKPLIQLFEEKYIQFDLIKCPDWEGMLREAQPYGQITIHYDLKTGFGEAFTCDLARIKKIKERTQTPHINTHLVTPPHFDINSQQERQHINNLWRDELTLLTGYFGSEAIALEHFPYTQAMPHIRYVADSAVFSNVIEDTGCMLLLDLAHARITADTLGIDVRDYIASFPLDRLVELHVTGIRIYNGILTDHFGMADQDWSLFNWALAQIRAGQWRKPNIVAFEYGGVGEVFVWRTDINVLRDQVPLLYRAIHQAKFTDA